MIAHPATEKLRYQQKTQNNPIYSKLNIFWRKNSAIHSFLRYFLANSSIDKAG